MQYVEHDLKCRNVARHYFFIINLGPALQTWLQLVLKLQKQLHKHSEPSTNETTTKRLIIFNFKAAIH